MVCPISAGLCTVRIPAARIALYFSAAVPCPPLMIAPAWPMRRPGGAVCPAMNPTTGFFTFFLMYSAATSSALPPISPIITMAWVSGSSLNSLIASRKRGADNRIAADSDAGGLPDAQMRELIHGFVSERPAAAHHAHVALLVN